MTGAVWKREERWALPFNLLPFDLTVLSPQSAFTTDNECSQSEKLIRKIFLMQELRQGRNTEAQGVKPGVGWPSPRLWHTCLYAGTPP
jgi:hypothetical protein